MIEPYSIDGLVSRIEDLEQLNTGSDIDSVNQLRQQLSEAQHLSMKVTVNVRKLLIIKGKREREAYRNLSETEDYKKAKVSEKEILRREYLGEVDEDVKFLKSTEDMLDKRCTTAQSLLKSVPSYQPTTITQPMKPEF